MQPLRGTRPKTKNERTALSLLLGDASALGLWVFLSSVFEELSALLAAAFGLPPLVAGLAVLCSGLALYDPICTAVGGKGASFNPSQNFAFAAAGRGTLRLHVARCIAQTAGGVLGASAALRAIPKSWQGRFSNYAHGVLPGTSLLVGALAEGSLSFLLNLAILWSIDTRFRRIATLAPYIATVILVPLGAGFSGPFMNPAFAFSWFYHLSGVQLWEHVAVYWIGCLVGSYLAGLLWWHITTPVRKAPHSKARLAASRQAADRGKRAVQTAGNRKEKKAD